MSQKKQRPREKTSAEVFAAGKMAELPANDEEFTMETREVSPAHLLIKIESFSLLWKLGIQKYESKQFEAGDCKWRLIIHPNGLIKSENDEDDHISVYLAIVKSSSMPVGWEVNAFFNIFLYSQVLDNYLCFQGKMRRFHALKPQWGFSKLISKESLRAPGNGFLVDDNCVFGAEVAVVRPQRVTQCVSVWEMTDPYKKRWKISDFSKLGEVWSSEEFTAGYHKWKIQLLPNGSGSEEGQNVSLFLYLLGTKSADPNEKVKADYCFRIKNQLNDRHHHSKPTTDWFNSSGDSWGYPAFIRLCDMCDPNKGFIVKDCCFLEVELSVKRVVRGAS